MPIRSTSQISSKCAGKGRGMELLATFAAVSGAAMLVGIVIALISMLLVLATWRADAQGPSPTVAMPLLPSSVAFDAAGNLYFSDTNRQVVYESSLAGVLSIVAGDGVQGFGGDGAAATSAELNAPQGVAVGLGWDAVYRGHGQRRHSSGQWVGDHDGRRQRQRRIQRRWWSGDECDLPPAKCAGSRR